MDLLLFEVDMNILTGKEILDYLRYLDDHVKAYKKCSSFRPSKRIGFLSPSSCVEELTKERQRRLDVMFLTSQLARLWLKQFWKSTAE